MRARNIKPGFFKNEDLAELPFEGRLLFIGLWCLADREGRLEDRPKRIKAEIFSFDSVDVDKLLSQLMNFGFILRYEVQGLRYIEIPNFVAHQCPHYKEKPSMIPPSFSTEPQTSTSTNDAKTQGSGVDDKTKTQGSYSNDRHKSPEQAQGKTRESPSTVGGQTPSDSLIPDSKTPPTPQGDVSVEKTGGEPKRRNASEYSPDFETFWMAYPRKEAKGSAYKAWQKQKPPLSACLSALAWQKKSDQWTKDAGSFIPHPASWINARRWEDEPAPAVSTPNRPVFVW